MKRRPRDLRPKGSSDWVQLRSICRAPSRTRPLLGEYSMNRTPFAPLPHAGRRAGSRRPLQALCIVVLVGLGPAADALAADPAPDKAARDYARAISQAQADLDAGRSAKAR